MTLVFTTLTAVVYVGGIVAARRRDRRLPITASVAFLLALLIGYAAVSGPFDAWCDRSLSLHMLQHFVLIGIVAPLLVIGAPLRVLLAATPPAAARKIAAAFNTAPARALFSPIVAWLQFIAVLYIVHFSGLYEAALEHENVHAFEHVVFVVSAVMFWQAMLAVAPAPHAASHALRMLFLLLALPVSAFLGFVLYVARAPLYAHYAALPDALGDQQNAGALMWLAGGAPLFVALLACGLDWARTDRRRQASIERKAAA